MKGVDNMMKRYYAFILAILIVVVSFLVYLPVLGEVFQTPIAAEDEIIFRTLEYGIDGDDVSSLQSKLASLGYYSGNISGRYREGTRAAIRNFQSDFGLEVTGIADIETQQLLFTSIYRPLQYGSSGDDVKALQTRLTELKYYHGKISGNYLEGSTSAIGTFQEKNSLTKTGKADVKTQEQLFSPSAIAKDSDEYQGNLPLPGDEDIVITGDGETVNFEELNKDYSKKLQRGSKGSNVKEVQKRLTELGFFSGPISGNYMNQTIAAVKEFQTYNGLESDGVTGEVTWNALFNDSSVVDISATPRPTPIPTPVPYAMTVDVNNQVVSVYGLGEDGKHTRIVRQMIASTGKKATPSDVGDWVLDGRTARWCYFPAYGSHAQYWTRINSSIAFHSVIYNKVDTMALSVGSYNALGSRASHGCIRLLVSDAKWVYENIGKGTIVTITEDLPKDEELNKSLQPPALNRRNMLPKTTPEPTPTPAYTFGGSLPEITRNLKVGTEGDDVFWLQMTLKELGYYKGTVTGGFYSGTKQAVKDFQKENNIRNDGVAGSKTIERLYELASTISTPDVFGQDISVSQQTHAPVATVEQIPTPEI